MEDNYWIDRMRKWIKGTGLNQTDLAKKAGISQSQISHLMTGKRDFTFNTVDKILQVLGFSYQELFLKCDQNGKGDIINFPLTKRTVEYEIYHDHHIMLNEIYESKNRVMISAINSNIVAFHESIVNDKKLQDALDRINRLEQRGG